MAIRGLEGNMQAQPRVFAHDAVLVTKSDTVDIPNTSERGCCLYVGVTGDYSVVMEGDGEVTFKGVIAGSFLPVLVKRVTSGIASVGDVVALF